MDREFNSSKNSMKLSRSKQLLLEQASTSTSASAHPESVEYSPSFIKDGPNVINKNSAMRASVSAKNVSHPKPHLPSHTEIHSVSPSAAGFPVLEVIRVLESENILSKDDRIFLKEGLYNPDVNRREEVVKALCDVELSMHSQFSIRRLKSVIHQNPSGLPKATSSSFSSGVTSGNSAAAAYINSRKAAAASVAAASSNDSVGIAEESFHSPVGRQKVDVKLNFNQLENGSSGVSSMGPASSGRSHKRHQQQSPLQVQTSNINSSPSLLPSPEQPMSTRHTNGAVGSSSKHPNNQQFNNQNLSPTQIALNQFNNANFDLDEPSFQIQSAINKAVGDSAQYSGPSQFNVLEKITARHAEYEQAKAAAASGNGSSATAGITTAAATTGTTGVNNIRSRKYCVIVGCGSFNPLTRMHLRTFYLAKQYVESRLGYLVLGTLLSPAHGVTVRERFRTNVNEIIPSPHRLAVAQLLVQNSKWLSIDPWEITRRRPMDYLSLLEHVQAMLRDRFPETEIKVFYFSKGNMIPKLSPQALRLQNFGCVCVTRAPESDNLRASLNSKWNGIISVVEDSAILDASVDVVTSRKVRDKIRSGESVAYLVGEKINDYVNVHHLGPKMNGEEEWTDLEKALPRLESRPAEVHLRSQSVSASTSSGGMTSSISMKSINSANNGATLTAVTAAALSPNFSTTVAASAYIPSWGDAVTSGSSGARASGVQSIQEVHEEDVAAEE